ncbi:hypothetical protein D3C72_1278140 [compost metagenome]
MGGANGRRGLAHQHRHAAQAVLLDGREVFILGGQQQAVAQVVQARHVGLGQGLLHLFQPGTQPFGFRFAQLAPLTRHTAGQAQQAEQVVAEHAQGHGALAATVAFEPGVLALGIHRHDAPQHPEQALALLAFALQGQDRRLHPALPGIPRLARQLAFHPLRPEQRAGQGGAEDAKADFRGARHGLVEYPQRLGDGRQANDGDRVAGEHEGIGPGAAHQGRGGGADAQPGGQRQQEEPGRLREERHDGHRHDRSHQRAEQPRQPLLHHHARQRLGDDEGRHQRPLRLLQAEAERAPERQPGAQQGLDDELQRRDVGRQEGTQGVAHRQGPRMIQIEDSPPESASHTQG